MMPPVLDFSPRGRARVWLVTALGTLTCAVVALFVDSFNFSHLQQPEIVRAIATDILLPIALAGPMLTFLMAKLRELSITKHELTILASTDSLTAVLNRGAFTLIVDAYLEKVRSVQLGGGGALLLIDVDDFKKINDSFGHDLGDMALKIIARAIKATVREIDLVGRIGGEEFGIFLPGTTVQDASEVAERIRDAVAAAEFRPQGSATGLSVSVGGASFARHMPYDQLFHIADQRLYIAKAQGKNRVEMGTMAVA